MRIDPIRSKPSQRTRHRPRWPRWVAALPLLSSVLLAAPTAAGNDACREWWGEHQHWKTEVVRRYLGGRSQRELDAAVFELLQREAWLTSCEQSAAHARAQLVGWRLIERPPEEYASAVMEALLEGAGFDVSLATVVGSGASPAPAEATAGPGRPAWIGMARAR